jgi:hypothetical protein
MEVMRGIEFQIMILPLALGMGLIHHATTVSACLQSAVFYSVKLQVIEPALIIPCGPGACLATAH